jgi:hypothetical protein
MSTKIALSGQNQQTMSINLHSTAENEPYDMDLEKDINQSRNP